MKEIETMNQNASETSTTDSIQTAEMTAIDRAITGFTIDRSDAMQRFARGEGKPELVADSLAREFLPFCFEFPLFLAAAISHVRDDDARLLLVSNLYEEHGELDPAKIHPEMFRRFVRALGLDPRALQDGAGTVGKRTADRVMEICRTGPAHRALAALYAIELLFGAASELFGRGLERLGLSLDAREFFVVHAFAEEHHAEQLRVALATSCRSSADRKEALAIASEVSRIFYELFDHIATPTVLKQAA